MQEVTHRPPHSRSGSSVKLSTVRSNGHNTLLVWASIATPGSSSVVPAGALTLKQPPAYFLHRPKPYAREWDYRLHRGGDEKAPCVLRIYREQRESCIYICGPDGNGIICTMTRAGDFSVDALLQTPFHFQWRGRQLSWKGSSRLGKYSYACTDLDTGSVVATYTEVLFSKLHAGKTGSFTVMPEVASDGALLDLVVGCGLAYLEWDARRRNLKFGNQAIMQNLSL